MNREHSASVKFIDSVNIGLIVLSLFLSFIIPFQLFLVAYAILGPLHYLTEINWIRTKGFFIKDAKWLAIASVLALWVALPKVYFYFTFNNVWLDSVFAAINESSNAAVFLCLCYLMIIILGLKRSQTIIFMILGILFSMVMLNEDFYVSLFGFLIPTLLHVYVFTILFMLYGALNNASKLGVISVILMLLAGILIFVFPYRPAIISETVLNTYINSGFNLLNERTGSIGGGSMFSISNVLTWKVQVFIAFAYLYHYLNWFSKTGVIQWHKGIKKKRVITIVVLWLAMISAYIYDYAFGFALTLFFSYLHVFLEFPINLKTVTFLVNYKAN